MKQTTTSKMTLLSVILFAISYCSTAFSAEYIRVSDYLKQFPEQESVMNTFSEQVRSPSQAVSQKYQQATPVKLAVVYPAIQSSDYWLRSTAAFEARLKELRLPYELKTYYSRPSVDLSLQAEQLGDAIRWEPDYLIFTMDALRHRSMIERLLVRGKPKLILQNITTPLKQWRQKKPFLYVGFDHETGTRIMADRMNEILSQKKETDKKARYLMLYFSRGYVSQMRGDTFVDQMNQRTDIEQVASYFTDGSRKKAYQATIATLSEHQDLDLIFACSTDIALGALDALREKNLVGKIMINGWGGGSSELTAIQNQELD